MLTDLETFKAGFLTRCVEEGISTDEALSRVKSASARLDAMEKQADIPGYGMLRDLLKGIAGVATPVVSKATDLATTAGVFGPPILGGIAGYGVSKMTDVDEEDVDDIKKEELVDEYRRQAHKLRQSKALRAYRDKRKERGGVYL
jgi:hypothetical protein